jgi:hypothetical protein
VSQVVRAKEVARKYNAADEFRHIKVSVQAIVAEALDIGLAELEEYDF